MASLRCSSALSTAQGGPAALREACERALAGLGGAPDLAVLFASHHHAAAFDEMAEEAARATGAPNLLGCAGEAVVGGAREVEQEPAVSLFLARLPGVEIRTFPLSHEETPDGGTFTGWPEELLAEGMEKGFLLLLADPFSFPADEFLERMNEDHKGVLVAGGMASGGSGPGQNRLFLGARAVSEGAVAAFLRGKVEARTVVSQGCRPVGQSFVVTEARENVLFKLGGQPAVQRLEQVLRAMSPEDRGLIQGGLHVGCVVDEYRESFRRGDFLVRNVFGIDPERGALVVGDRIRAGQTVQFHVRDAATADEDLREMLARAKSEAASPPLGALVFTCNGRGARLFGRPDHDASALASCFVDLPAAGFFAQGELGPVGGRNCLHGFTASLVLFAEGGA